MSKYSNLVTKVHDRDNNTCRLCGRGTNAPPHHIMYKSHGGADKEENLITLCAVNGCHRKVHTNERKWRDILITMQEKIYGHLDKESLTKKSKYHNFKYNK